VLAPSASSRTSAASVRDICGHASSSSSSPSSSSIITTIIIIIIIIIVTIITTTSSIPYASHLRIMRQGGAGADVVILLDRRDQAKQVGHKPARDQRLHGRRPGGLCLPYTGSSAWPFICRFTSTRNEGKTTSGTRYRVFSDIHIIARSIDPIIAAIRSHLVGRWFVGGLSPPGDAVGDDGEGVELEGRRLEGPETTTTSVSESHNETIFPTRALLPPPRSFYCLSPLSMHSLCMQHQVISYASLAAIL
jgi:hypothetical protein